MSNYTPSASQPELPSTQRGPEIPFGYCHCGCGQKTSLATKTDKRRGYVKGQPLSFISRHRHVHFVEPTLQAGVRAIPLTKGKFAIVDAADYERLSQFKWHAMKHRNTFYARGRERLVGGLGPLRFMHSLILGATVGVFVDHKDGDGLNNLRENLRFATTSQNGWNVNKRPSRGSEHPSQFKGVYWDSARKCWIARIVKNKKRTYLGGYQSEYDAALAYDVAAFKLHGEYARFNLVTYRWLTEIFQ